MNRRRRLKIRLQELREERNYTVEELASILHCRPGQIVDWENLSIIPSVRRVIQMAKHFECSTDYFLGLTDESEPYDPPEEYEDEEYEEYDDNEREHDEQPKKAIPKWVWGVAIAFAVFIILVAC